jgi:hypothetical protein
VIRVHRPRRAPAILLNKGKAATKQLLEEYDGGARQFTFNAGIYGAASVKAALGTAQHGKCAFCESRVTHIAYGDVEHYRPKAGHRQTDGDPLRQPGYYWLAYRWSNLLFACQICNQRFKKNLFPLKDPARRALSHHHDLKAEEPLLIDPARTTPSVHLRFREEYAFARRSSLIGETTIELLGLNRPELVEFRRDRLEKLKLLAAIRDHLTSLPKSERSRSDIAHLRKLQAALEHAVSETAEYAAMARVALSAD